MNTRYWSNCETNMQLCILENGRSPVGGWSERCGCETNWTGSGFCWVGRTPLLKCLLSTPPGIFHQGRVLWSPISLIPDYCSLNFHSTSFLNKGRLSSEVHPLQPLGLDEKSWLVFVQIEMKNFASLIGLWTTQPRMLECQHQVKGFFYIVSTNPLGSSVDQQFLLFQSLLNLKDRFDHFLTNSFSKDRLFKQAISSVSNTICMLPLFRSLTVNSHCTVSCVCIMLLTVMW